MLIGGVGGWWLAQPGFQIVRNFVDDILIAEMWCVMRLVCEKALILTDRISIDRISHSNPLQTDF